MPCCRRGALAHADGCASRLELDTAHVPLQSLLNPAESSRRRRRTTAPFRWASNTNAGQRRFSSAQILFASTFVSRPPAARDLPGTPPLSRADLVTQHHRLLAVLHERKYEMSSHGLLSKSSQYVTDRLHAFALCILRLWNLQGRSARGKIGRASCRERV